jgi:hypothetical protein
MSEDERELLEDLRALAEESPREAPQQVEERLVAAFRRRSRRRRLAVWGPVAGIGAIAAAVTLLFWTPQAPHRSLTPEPASAVQADIRSDEIAADFYRLPEADSLPEVENAMVVRVQLPGSSLRLMGVPVAEERDPEAIQADVLLGQDGLARAVRLVE